MEEQQQHHIAPQVHQPSAAAWVRPLRNPQRELAAQLLAGDVITDDKIAERVGISKRQLQTWKKHTAFKRRLDFLLQTFADRALRHGIARRDKRVQSAQDDYDRLGKVIEARAADPILKRVTGGETGAMVLTGYELTYLPKKRTKVAEDGKVTEEEYIAKQSAPLFAVDTALFKTRADIRTEIGRELGQLPNELPAGAALGEVKLTVIYGDEESGQKVGVQAVISGARVQDTPQAPARETIGGFEIMREEENHQGWQKGREDGDRSDNGGGGVSQG